MPAPKHHASEPSQRRRRPAAPRPDDERAAPIEQAGASAPTTLALGAQYPANSRATPLARKPSLDRDAWAMSHEDVEAVREAHEAWESEGVEGLIPFLDARLPFVFRR